MEKKHFFSDFEKVWAAHGGTMLLRSLVTESRRGLARGVFHTFATLRPALVYEANDTGW